MLMARRFINPAKYCIKACCEIISAITDEISNLTYHGVNVHAHSQFLKLSSTVADKDHRLLIYVPIGTASFVLDHEPFQRHDVLLEN